MRHSGVCSCHQREGKERFSPIDGPISSTECETEGFPTCVLRCKSTTLEAILQLALQDACLVFRDLVAKGSIAHELLPHLMSLSERSEGFVL